jgi:hypothetical protein
MGIKALVMKPVNWHDLAATVRKVLNENDQGMKIAEMQSVAQAAR